MLSKSLENISLDYCGACPSYIKGTNEVLTCFEEFGFFYYDWMGCAIAI